MASRSHAQHEQIARNLGIRDLMAELVRLVKADNSGFANRTRIRQIGEELNRQGGMDLLREAYYHVRSTGTYFSQDIWHMIGEWRQ